MKKGAVAIGGKQTGIYPCESPGGWQIMGRTPIELFDPGNNDPCFAKAGDQIRFYPVTMDEFKDIEKLVESGYYVIESEVIDD